MTILTIPPERIEDIDRVKEFLFQTLGDSPWTEEAYLVYADRFPRLVELSEGRLVVLEMPSPRHQRIVQSLFKQLDAWAQQNGGEAFVAPLPVRLWPGKFREPDVILFTAAGRERVRDDYVDPPDLAVEVQWPGTARLDALDKREEYAQAGIAEYWRVDSEQRQIEQNLMAGDRYTVHAVARPGDRLTAVAAAGLVVEVAAVFGEGG